MPWPKNATDITPITSTSLFRKFAVTIVEASTSPVMIGSLRAMFAEPVRRSRKSETMPPTITPTDAAMNGRTAKKPTFSHAICRSVARYVGNQVRKNTSVELPANWPIDAPRICRLLSRKRMCRHSNRVAPP